MTMAEDRTNTDLAREVIELLVNRGGPDADGPDDPIPDEGATLLAEGLKRVGFISELLRQAKAAGVELDARMWAELLIAGVQARRH